MPSSNNSSSREELPIKGNGKLFSRARHLLTKENNRVLEAGGSVAETGETSFRVYYGETGAAVPFIWESQPGTPKHPIFKDSPSNDHNFLPPLTPPPSYTSSSSLKTSSHNKNPKPSKILSALLLPFSKKSSHVTPTSSSVMSSSSSYSSSSSSSSLSEKQSKCHRRSLSLCSYGATDPLFYEDEEEHEDVGSPNNNKSSAMCFGFKKQGCYSTRGH